MTLMEKELEKRKKNKWSFKNKLDDIKQSFKEQRDFNRELKETERRAYKNAMVKEAKKYGSHKAKQRYAKKKQGKSKIKFKLPKNETPGFMKLPKDKENAFDW